MRSSICCFKKSASSNRWLARQQSDPFVKLRTSPKSANDQNSAPTQYRSRAAYKLVSLSNEFKQLLPRGGTVIDLGCAPGGWAQVAASRVGDRGKVIGVDLLPVRSLGEEYPNVTLLQGDFLAAPTHLKLSHLLRKGVATIQVDTVISDMMANMTGNRIADVENSLDLCRSALQFAQQYLKRSVRVEIPAKPLDAKSVASAEGLDSADQKQYNKSQQSQPLKTLSQGGSLILKHFAHPDFLKFKKTELEPSFRHVKYVKPESSRSESSEGYFVCLGFHGAP